MAAESSRFEHTPVMVERVTAVFAPVPEGTFIDATLGAGGHALAVLDAHPHLRLLGLDQDPVAIEAARGALACHGDRVRLRRGRFDRLVELVSEEGLPPVSGVLFDLGVSSPQLDRPQRGFSYRHDGPLDMRMDPARERTADEVVNGYDRDGLVRVLREHGDERFARRIADAIVAQRPIRSTAELAHVVVHAIPAATRRRGPHPATRTFQAIRIEVNDELEVLPAALDDAVALLVEGGRLAVLSYHSGEDRIVKAHLDRGATGGCTCPPDLPCGCGAKPTLRLLRRGGWTPDEDEVRRNPRSASARLRAAEKLPEVA